MKKLIALILVIAMCIGTCALTVTAAQRTGDLGATVNLTATTVTNAAPKATETQPIQNPSALIDTDTYPKATSIQNVLDVSAYQFISDVYLDRSGLYGGVENFEVTKGLLEFYYEQDGLMQIQCDAIRQDKSLMQEILAWETLTFSENAGELITGASQTSRYEIILLELLKSTLKDAKFREKLNNSVAAVSAAPSTVIQMYYNAQGMTDADLALVDAQEFIGLIGEFKKLSDECNALTKIGRSPTEIYDALDLTSKFGNLSLDQINATINNLNDNKAFKTIDSISNVFAYISFGLSGISDVTELINAANLYDQLSNIGKEYIKFLDVLKNYCENTDFSAAVSNVRNALACSWDAGMECFWSYLHDRSADYMKLVWDGCIAFISSSNPIFGVAVLTYETFIGLSNFSFGTGDKIEKLYVSIAFSDIYVAIQKANHYCMNLYLENNSEDNAKLFVAATDLLFATLVSDCDYAASYLNEVISKGVLTKFFTDNGTIQNVQNGIDSCNNLKNTRKEAFDLIKDLAVSLYIKALNAQGVFVDTDFDLDGGYGEDINNSAVYIVDRGTWGKLSWTLDSNGLLVISGTGNINAFASNSTQAWKIHKENIQAVSIRYGVTSIGDFAFYECSKFTTIYIPDSVTSIGYRALEKCSKLTNINIPDSVTSIGSAFWGCHSLQNVYINDIAAWCAIRFNGDSISNPLEYANNLYLNGVLLTDVVIPDGVTSIPIHGFSCNSITSITIPDSVTSIGGSAFRGCSKLTNIYIPDSVTSMKQRTFEGCSALESIRLSKNLVSIGEEMFYGCSSLKSINIPDSVSSIGEMAFYNCSSLSSVSLGDGVVSIGEYAFYKCSSMKSINISSSVTLIKGGAFKGCTSLQKVYINDITAWCGIDFEDYSENFQPKYETNPLYHAHNLYLNGKLVTELVIPQSVTVIKSQAFLGCTSLTSVTLPDGVYIEPNAFKGCSSLVSVTFPDSVTRVDGFEGCTSLEKVFISDIAAWCAIDLGSVSESNPLYYAHNLYLNGELVTELVIPQTVTVIKPRVFMGCTSLTSVTLPDGLTSIGGGAFSGCSSLTSINIPDSVTYIGSNTTFYGCSSLTNISIPKGVSSIGTSTFECCFKLKSIVLHNNITSIGSYAFYRCPDKSTIYFFGKEEQWNNINIGTYNSYISTAKIIFLTSIDESEDNSPDTETMASGVCNANINWALNFQTGVLRITGTGDMPIYTSSDPAPWHTYNILIKSVEISNGIATVGMGAFYNCSYLVSITIPKSVTTIADFAFYGCSAITTVYYASSPSQWKAISMGGNNAYLTSASIIYGETDNPFEFAEGADVTNVVVSTVSEQVYIKVGGMSAADVSALFASAEISINDANGTAVTGAALVGTGYIVTSTVNGVTESRAIVVLGDINGDGMISSIDHIGLRGFIKQNTRFEGVYLQACDLNGDKSCDTLDYIQLKQLLTN